MVKLVLPPLAKSPTPFPDAITRLTAPDPPPTMIPLLPLLVTTVSETNNVPAALGAKLMPELVKLWTTDFWMVNDRPEVNWIPMAPALPPSISSPRKLMESLAPALIVIAAPLVANTPPTAPSLVIVTALLMVTGP